MIPSTPFLKTYDAVYNLLFEGAGNKLADIVKIGNRISYGSLAERDRNITKATVTSADVPELQLVDEGGLFNGNMNSSGMGYTQNLLIAISTGDLRYGSAASLVNWYLLCNISKWRTNLTNGVTWNGKSFIKNIKQVPIQIGESNPERNRNLTGWNIIWRLQVDIFIETASLIYQES